jgi:AraC-like DNA-binding protein
MDNCVDSATFVNNMQLPPQHLLQGLVKHYLIIDQKTNVQQDYRMFSDGNPGIVFHLKDPFLQRNGEDLIAQAQPQCFIYGQLTHYNTIIANGNLNMIVVVLEPYVLFTHFHMAAYELNDQAIPLEDLFGKDVRHLQDRILEALTTSAAIGMIENFLLRYITPLRHISTDFRIAMNLIYQHQGLISIEDLLKTLPITERQLERKFREHIGTSPKSFTDIIKFQHFLKLLQKQSSKEKIAGLIYESGYYDHAHLNRNFKKMTGLTPAHYKDATQLLAINLMPVH